MIIELVLFCITLCISYFSIKPKRPKNFPPGPENYPIIGGTHIFDKNLIAPFAIKKIGEKYGPVCGLYLGKSLAVLVNGYEACKEVLSRDDFSERPDFVFGADEDGNLLRAAKRNLGIMFSRGNVWKEQRRFMLRSLRDFGFGKTSLEGLIHEEIAECVSELEKKVKSSSNGIVQLDDIFNVSIINILWAIVSGIRYKHDDEKFKVILKKLYETFRSGDSRGNLILNYPWLRHLPYFKQKWNKHVSGRNVLVDLINDTILTHEHRSDRKENPLDFIDLYLNEIEIEKEKGIQNSTFSKKQLVETGIDMFSAGAESTSNSLAFALLYMIHHPEVRKKVQIELESVFGHDQPSYSDKSKVPYTEAVLSELFRISNIAGLTVPHCTTVDTTLNNYNIPKGTTVMVNVYSVLNDEAHWKDPQNFRPERFLNHEGKFVPSERMFAFGHGKRACPGEILARVNYFLFFTTFMINFDFEAEDQKHLPSKVPLDGFTLAPQPFKGKVVKRILK